ncbi:phosphoglycerate dehydrogenase [Botrimarina hoheduenensis]|uniref:D-3-phosphoglycerate dehydrogenase n=1 Tax=Botrimarina hoheduenensis TaxID=2528000 RepID=A0A5C5WFK5_9BACT|nr:phosphoglycerate dehydrogenase [Botrimarina hoheduenensis]TWT48891.1 D-3-phosphoglycerate dehydrogenase [Botrimarina hoheduenensis]
MPSVLVLDPLSDEGLALLEAAEGVTYEVRTGLSGDALKKSLNEFDGAICRSGVKITPESLEGNTRLKAIVRAGVGTDNIDKKAATRAGIVVMNTPAGNTVSTAEQTIALLLAMSRNVAPAYQSLIEGRWDRKKFMGTQVSGKTLGIVGLGRIGMAVATRAKALEMNLIGYDPFMSAEHADKFGIELVENVADMLPRLDYLTVHTPLTDETRGLIGPEQVAALKPGARLVNCARGGIYDEAALVEGLKSGKLGGVALDVFPEEPCTENPLFGMDGVVCTPHLGASTEEAQNQVAVEAVELLTAYLMTGAIRCAVNVAALDPKTLAALKGYIDVAHRLGRLCEGLLPSGIESCRLTYRGELADKETKILASAFAAGLLERAMGEEVNLINAESLLTERGIQLVTESCSTQGAFRASMSVEVAGGGKSHTLIGTLLGQDMPRLVSIDGYRLEAFLDGTMLVFTHKDVPGIIGAIGIALGEGGVNIAQMAVGRDKPGGDAIGVLNVDGDISDSALSAVRAHKAISSATVVQLPAAGTLPHWLG